MDDGDMPWGRTENLLITKHTDLFAPVTVVVASQYAGVMLRRALAADHELLTVICMIIPRLAGYLGSPTLAKEGKAVLTPLVELASIRHIATESVVDGPQGAVSHHPGLLGLLRRACYIGHVGIQPKSMLLISSAYLTQ